MLFEIIKRFNWLDIFVVIILFRVCYIAIKNGFSVECFKLLGTLTATYLALHYFTVISDFTRKGGPAEKMPLEFLDFISFVFLAILGYSILFLLRIVFCRFIKLEAVPYLNKWGGFVLGIARGILFSGLITFMLVISSIDYFKNSVKDSYFGSQLFKVAPSTYSWLWNSISSKFMSGEKFNETIPEVQEGFFKK